jgi:aspartyl-tRNA(Asn)/glutamyl-tRNA(Gln) amidotransferase subunit C
MSLSADDIHRLAHLARLSIPESERESLSEQLSQIVALVDQLSEVDTDGVEPMVHAFDLQNVLASDRVAESLPRVDVLGNAPAQDGEYFLVPPVLG